MPAQTRVALLVDGDNLSSAHAAALLLTAASYGAPILRRVYGNVATLNGWSAAPGFKLVHSGTGKNATDLLLTVEAMTLMLTAQADILIIATCDRDFTHLAQNLTERGQTVIGIGTDQAPAHLRQSCTTFHLLAAPAIETPATPRAPTQPDPMVAQVSALLAQDPLGLLITDLSVRMRTTHQTQISQTSHKSWRAFLTAHDGLFDCDTRGPTARVRLKSAKNPCAAKTQPPVPTGQPHPPLPRTHS